MRPELRDRLMAKLDELARQLDEPDFASASSRTVRILQKLTEIMEPATSRNKLATFLDEMPEPSRMDELLMLASIRFMPFMLRAWLKGLASKADRNLPALPSGRPGVDVQTRQDVIDFVADLFKHGVSLEMSKKRAALHFAISESTVQRVWDDRGGVPEPDFKSAAKWLEKGLDNELRP